MAKVGFDGANKTDLDDEEKEIFVKLFGPDVVVIPPECRSIVVIVFGARAGKTYLSALFLLFAAVTCDLSTLAPGEEAIGVVIAPTLNMAMQSIRYIVGAINSAPALRSMLASKPSPQRVRIRRGDQVVTIEPRAAVRAGVGSRGFSLIGATLEESAFFYSEEYTASDLEIFSSAYVRLLPKAKMLIVSTPWIRSGLLWDKFDKNWNHPVDAIAATGPTMLILPTERNRIVIEQSRREDPEKTEREYDAVFASSAVSCFFSPECINAAIDDSLPVDGWEDPRPGDLVKAGCDFGFSSDSSCISITHTRAGVTYLAEVIEKRPPKDGALKAVDVIREFAKAGERHFINYFMSDLHYKHLVIDILSEYGIYFMDAPRTPSDAYIATRILLHSGRLRIPRHPRLIAQLRETRAKKSVAGVVQMVNPHMKGGGHGDLVSSLVLACFQVCGERIPEEDLDPNSPEGRAQLNDRLKEHRRIKVIEDVQADSDSQSKWWKSSPDQRRSGFATQISNLRSSRRDRFSRN